MSVKIKRKSKKNQQTNDFSSAKDQFMYTIYGLVDPRDSLIRYVGITDDIYRRFKNHIGGNSKNLAKDSWIKSLKREQEMVAMQILGRAESYQEALHIEKKWIHQLLAEGCPLFNIVHVEIPPVKEPVTSRSGKLLLYDGSKQHYTSHEIDQILDWYLIAGELPDVSERQRYHYRHHPRLEDRRKLLRLKPGRKKRA